MGEISPIVNLTPFGSLYMLRDLEMLAIDDDEQDEDRKEADKPDEDVPQIAAVPDATSAMEQKDEK